MFAVYCCITVDVIVLVIRERLLPDFGRIDQNKINEEDKDRGAWNNQVSFSLFFYIA